MNAQMNERMEKKNELINLRIFALEMIVIINECINEWMDEWMNGWMDDLLEE